MASSSGGGRFEHDFVRRVAGRLAAARREQGLSQESLAAVLGIAVKNLQRIESGKQNLSLRTIERICSALDVLPESLFQKDAALRTITSGVRPANRRTILQRLQSADFIVRSATSRGRLPSAAVPVTTLRAAAGHLTSAARAVETLGYVSVPRRGSAPEGQFVAEVVGRSMEPRIASGSVCLFQAPRPPPYEDRILLVTHAALASDELGGPYALKRIGSATLLSPGRTRVVLESINPDFAPITLDVDDDEFRIVAELARVLVRGSSPP